MKGWLSLNRNNSVSIRIPISFFIINFAWTWFFWLGPSWLAGLGAPFLSNALCPAAGIIASFGPGIGAMISLLLTEGKGECKKFLKSFFSLNFGWKVWASILLVLGGSSFLAWFVPELFGAARPPQMLPSLAVFPLYFLLMVFLAGGQEEIGWRAYIMPRLEKKFGLLLGSGMLGIIWAIWHIPLWFMPGTNQIYMNYFAFMLGCVGLSYFFSWVVAASGKRNFSSLIAHGAMNAFMLLFPPISITPDAVQPRFWLSQILIFVIGVTIAVMRTKKNKT
jgi:membrane protease YdiL (CAAX protease family)